jgi:hypothetical protein
MRLAGILALVLILVLFRLLIPPAPQLLSISRRWGKRTTILLCTVAILGAAAVILLSRR